MKSYDSRAYGIQEFVEWDSQKTLVLNPAFQRRVVWSEKAKSYLIDTILRGKPIPKVFMRQQINASTKSAIREVVDGQQRLSTILAYVKDGFKVALHQNEDFGGKYFSQLPESKQTELLSYEISVDLLINLPDAEVLDIFGRLNSYAVVLNDQEKINATHFSEFKMLADKIGFELNGYWLSQKILTSQEILRMKEVNLVADLLISLIEGIKSKKQIKTFYYRYEKNFNHNAHLLEISFMKVIEMIACLYPEGLANTEFRRVHIFYSLFTAVAHCLFQLKELNAPQVSLASTKSIQIARNGLDRISEIFSTTDMGDLSQNEQQFMQDSRSATTDEAVRERRTKFLIGIMA